MPVDVKSLMEALGEICEEKNLRIAVKENFKGGLITGAAATVSGLILGPIGLLLGGFVGGVFAASSAKGKFKSVPEIIKNMSPAQKLLLYNKIVKAFSNLGYDDIEIILTLLATSELKELALREVMGIVLAFAVAVFQTCRQKLAPHMLWVNKGHQSIKLKK